MRSVVVATVLSLAVPALAATTSSGLRGRVSIGPVTPVCMQGVPCSKPARRVTLTFARAGRLVRTRTDDSGRYRVLLPRGVYDVHASAGVSVRPARVHVTRVVARLDFAIDTGIR